MDPDHSARIKDLFLRSCALPEGERAAFLAEECSGDAELIEEVKTLLAQGDDALGVELSTEYVPSVPTAAPTPQELGPYRILDVLGKGGMGIVYRALDPRFPRQVAIKIIPNHLAQDPDRLHRFRMEARLAGRISHPNLVSVYDIGVSDGVTYVVMELLQGRTLREECQALISREQAIEYATQIADGLAAAHEHDIVHRDLKPENIIVMSDGRLKIIDFGIAKLTEDADWESLAEVVTTESMSTEADAALVGTPGYMAPEQINRQKVDQRVDIFALGAILYELLTGVRAFCGSTPWQVMDAVRSYRPPLPSQLRSDASNDQLDHVVLRCLEKEPAQRYQTAHDLKDALQLTLMESHAVRRVVRPSRRRWVALLALVPLTVAMVSLYLAQQEQTKLPVAAARFGVQLPNGLGLEGFAQASLSPNGLFLAFAARDTSGHSGLWIRDISDLTPRLLPDTEGAFYPFWSPDSRFVGFFAHGKMRKVPVSGGLVEIVCDAQAGRGASWNRSDEILFAPAPEGPLHLVSASGGASRPVTTLDRVRGQVAHRWPAFLPDGIRFLYLALPQRDTWFEVFLGQLGSSKATKVLDASSAAIYVKPGYLLYLRNDVLMAQRFDEETLRPTGPSYQLAPSYRQLGALGEPNVSGSENGSLAIVGSDPGGTRLVWLRRDGSESESVDIPWGSYFASRLSPNGKYVAVERGESGMASDVWVVDLTRGTSDRVTSDPMLDRFPQWSPDSKRIAFASNRGGTYALYEDVLDGVEAPQCIFSGKDVLLQWPTDWSSDGRWIACDCYDPTGGYDIVLVPMDADREPRTVRSSPHDEYGLRFSPDVRWLAYVSNESGRPEVYIESLTQDAVRHRVSSNGGERPRWRSDGAELFYVSLDGVLMSVVIDYGEGIRLSQPAPLFRLRLMRDYDVQGDGERFLCVLSGSTPNAPISLLMNWTANLPAME